MGFFKGRTTVTRANKISDFQVATAEYGSAVPEILGTTRVSGNVIYYDDFEAHEHRETHKAGKGGKSKSVSITYTYTVAIIIGLCEGIIKRINKIWVGKNIYDYGSDKVGLTLYVGTHDQTPWPYVVGKHPDKALAYPDLAYMCGVVDLGDSGSLPSYNFEVVGKLTETGDGVDVNPADYIRYILDKIGLSDVDIIGLDDYRKYCREYDLLISTPMDSAGNAKEARSIINDIVSLTNAYMFWSNDSFKIVVKEDRPFGSWTPNKKICYDLTADNFIPKSNGALVTYVRKDSSELYNQFPVEYINRNNGYEKETVSYALPDDINEYGVKQAGTVSAHYIYSKERAVKIAERLARDNQFQRVKYTFSLDWSFCRLEIGDLVTLTDENCGLEKQVAIIDSVTENADGTITFTAISYPDGDYGVAEYDVNDIDRPFIDFNADAPSTIPMILQPPADLTTNGLELWIGTKGASDNWGGCLVYVSDDGTNYREAGQIASSARFGKLLKTVSSTDTTIQVSSNGDFISGTEQDAEQGNTLCWLDGECISYETAEMIAEGQWKLSGCKRGQYNTTASEHTIDSQFIRLDSTILKLPFTKDDIGKKLFFKFTSYNIFGAGIESLADVQAYEYTLLPYYIPPVQNVAAYNRFRQLADGIARYDIVVKWDKPSLNSYLQADVWYKTNNTQELEGVKPIAGLKASEIGFAGNWIYGGSGESQVVIPQAVVGDTYLIAVCTKDKFGASVSPDAAPQTKITVAMKSTIPNVPDGFSIKFDKSAKVSWEEVTNTDIAWYEVRKDKSYGDEGDGLLARTTGLTATVQLTSRTGTLYLYARNALGKYSDPAVLAYNKSAPVAPAAPTLTSTLKGFNVLAKTSVPSGCIGMAVYISDSNSKITKVTTENNVYSHICGAGIYDVQIAWYDLFGEGNKSGSSRVTIKAQVDAELLADEAISLNKVDKNLKQVFNTTIPNMQEGITQNSDSITALVKDGKGYASAIAQNSTSITAVVTNLNTKDGYKNYTALSQLNDAINLRVAKNDVINQINMTSETTTIDGKHLHVTGNTVFDKNVIVSGMIQAGAVTADKLSVDSLSAITAKIGTLQTATSGARVVIKDNLIQVYDSNNVLRVRMGVW